MDSVLSIGEIAGYVASGLVFLTFYMRTMLPLRIVAIASNVAFIAYGAMHALVPIFVLHAFLLPLNIWRLVQIRRLMRATSVAAAGLSIEALLPHMTQERFAGRDVIFRRGDPASKLYYLSEGRVEVEEPGVVLEAGSLFGEIGLFAEDHARTATARCLTGCRLYSLSEEQVKLLYFQNPQFGYYVVRLVAKRLIENIRRLEADRADTADTAPPDRHAHAEQGT